MALGTRRKSSDKLAQFPVNFPSGTVIAFAGASAPEGWALCNGALLNRTTNAALYAAIGVAHGNGDGSTTFHLPDYRGSFLRGVVDITTKTGSGSAATNNATFTSHGVNRTGFKVRLQSGTLTGLAVSTDYFAIVVDSNTLAFATTKANALAETKIAISGVNSAVIVQYEDPDYSTRTASTVGGNTSNSVGSVQNDAIRNITGSLRASAFTGGTGQISRSGFVNGNTSNFNSFFSGGGGGADTGTTYTMSASAVVPTGADNRPQNSNVNYIIKL